MPQADLDLPPASVPVHSERRMLTLLGLACGVGVANIYYNQPLLVAMGRDLHVAPVHAGQVAVATQIGYSLGILLFVPLGDVVERRALMMRMFAVVAASMLLAALAPAFAVLLGASVAIGLSASVTHVAVPIAPELAAHEERGRAVGTVMTGLLLGILLARSVAGLISDWLSWRAVFYIGAVANLAFVPLLWKAFPPMPPRQPVPYRKALRSLWTLWRTEPLLRESAVQAALVFAAFSVFWTTLVFLLGSNHYRMGAGVAGSFGVLGASGALIAPLAGRLSDRHGTRFVVWLALGLLASAYGVLWAFGYHMAGLIAGVVLLDLGTQASQIANQTRIFGLNPGARGRINTVYMIVYFMGGSIGSFCAALVWGDYGWEGVCGLGLGFLALAALTISGKRPADADRRHTAGSADADEILALQ